MLGAKRMQPDFYIRTYGDRSTLGSTSATRLRHSSTAFRTSQCSQHNNSHTNPYADLNTQSPHTAPGSHTFADHARRAAAVV